MTIADAFHKEVTAVRKADWPAGMKFELPQKDGSGRPARAGKFWTGLKEIPWRHAELSATDDGHDDWLDANKSAPIVVSEPAETEAPQNDDEEE